MSIARQIGVRRWVMRTPDKDKVATLCNLSVNAHVTVSPLMARLLVNRGIDTPEKAAEFLSPLLRTGLRSPLLFPDMTRATDRILQARARGELVYVYGDYDVDGVTGSSQLLLFLREIGLDPGLYIPHRTKEGYGLNTQAIQSIAERGAKVLITADCGATAHTEVRLAQNLGVDVIICDHHYVPEQRPPAYAVLNPMEKGCAFSFTGLSGAGVVFYLLMGLRMRLREQGEINVPDLRRYLDLVTLGTVADLVPLLEENRVLVMHGLKEIERSQRVGIAALQEVSGKAQVSSSYIGFRLGPRLNAGGRLAEAQKAVELLTTIDEDRAKVLAADLDAENRTRQGIEEQILKDAIAKVEAFPDLPNRRSLVLASDEWHPGVIGIVASRLVERFTRPTFLIAIDGKKGKGSGRSIKRFHLYEGLHACAAVLEGYGGHRQAAGLSIQVDQIPLFAERFEAVAQSRLSASDIIGEIEVDDAVDVATITAQTMDDVQLLEPYGQGNPEPIFLARGAHVIASRVVGSNSVLGRPGHLKLVVRSSQGGRPIDAIGFGMGHWPAKPGVRIDMLYTPELNTWNGYTGLQLRLRDLKFE
ncbi:MAG: single-stranded-DNA-specific exonuclease RecJ [Candidatus Binatia bacterium]